MGRVEVDNLWMEYGDQIVLERLNIGVDDGEFCTIVGASGCGKTTFLKVLLGQEQPTRGEIRLDGVPLAPEPGVERGVVFQRYSVFPHLTVFQNVMLGAELGAGDRLLGRLWGAARKQACQQVESLLEAVGLTDAAGRYPHELSGGMQQRLAIAQSLIKKPRILLLDEPFGALDPGIRADMHTLIGNLWRETGTTVFMVTHDLQEGFHLGTRLLVFDRVRDDPQAQHRYGAQITYDLPIGSAGSGDAARQTLAEELTRERLAGSQTRSTTDD